MLRTEVVVTLAVDRDDIIVFVLIDLFFILWWV